jgi:carbon storage regulator
MLLLSRRIGETIIIGDDIEICICDIRGSQVRVGVNAPSNTAIHRKELYKKIKEELGDSRPMLSLAKSN